MGYFLKAYNIELLALCSASDMRFTCNQEFQVNINIVQMSASSKVADSDNAILYRSCSEYLVVCYVYCTAKLVILISPTVKQLFVLCRPTDRKLAYRPSCRMERSTT